MLVVRRHRLDIITQLFVLSRTPESALRWGLMSPPREALRSHRPMVFVHAQSRSGSPGYARTHRTSATTDTKRIRASRYVRRHLRASRYGRASPVSRIALRAATVPPQAGSHRRHEAVEDVFRISPSVPQGKRVISLSLTCCSRGQGFCSSGGWVRRVGRHGARVQLGQPGSPPPSWGR